jgi:hypothetical protein
VVFFFGPKNNLDLKLPLRSELFMSYLPKSRSTEIVVQNFEHETLIYDLIVNKAFCLNQTSMMVWRMCNGENSILKISQNLSAHLNSEVSEDLVRLSLHQLQKENLLENSEESQIELNRLSRRELIRRAGLASAIALPVISSVLAPTAAMAASACSNPGGSPSNTLKGICQAAVGQPPASVEGCTLTCQAVFGSTCLSCSTFATLSPSIPGAFECRCV